MTKEEAIEIVRLQWGFPGRETTSAKWVELFEKLGMLKLDEPLVSRQSPEYKLYEAMFEYVPGLDFLPFKQLIERASLKIVEK